MDPILTFNIITLFPECFPGPLGTSVIGKALKKQLWKLNTINITHFSTDRRTDDRPYSGGAGMLIKPDVIGKAIDHVLETNPGSHLVYLSASGAKFNQKKAQEMVAKKNITILCGRFEGVDYRAIEVYYLDELSIGDYVLSGGEIAAMAVVDCCVRLVPGVTGNTESTLSESFADGGILEHPQYTRPQIWRGIEVPKVLYSGHHAQIELWKKQQSLKITKKNRPDLLENKNE